MQIDAALFDFGGVLIKQGNVNEFAKMAPKADPAEVMKIVVGPYHEDTDHPWHQVERGELAMAEWHKIVTAALEEAGMEVVSRGEGGRLLGGGDGERKEGEVGITPNEPVLDAVRKVREAGAKTAIVTNNIREFAQVWRGLLPIDELFDDVIDSSEVGVRKPNPAIYNLTLDRLGVTADRAVFLDDIESNVLAARKVGLRGILVEADPQPAVDELLSLL